MSIGESLGLIAIYLKTAHAHARKSVEQARARRELIEIARRFNRRHTYVWPMSTARWMCPTCNAVHAATHCTVWTGYQYPACCEHREGQRHDREHATE